MKCLRFVYNQTICSDKEMCHNCGNFSPFSQNLDGPLSVACQKETNCIRCKFINLLIKTNVQNILDRDEYENLWLLKISVYAKLI